VQPPDSSFAAAAAAVTPPDAASRAAAVAHLDRLTKPPGSLGRLEALAAHLAAIAGCDPPPLPAPAAVAVFAGDHGVVRAEVTPWPSEVTAQMVANFCAGGAAINAIARQTGAEVLVVDVGVASELEDTPGLLRRKVRPGTGDITCEPAMRRDEAAAALDVGAEVADLLVSRGARCLLTGDMGIGNTTPSAALVAHFTGRHPAQVTGRGTGIDDAMLATKVAAVGAALARTARSVEPGDAMGALASLGGLEIAALAGYVVAGAAARVPVVVDGVIALAGALTAEALCPGVGEYLVAGHRSVEPGASAALEHLGLEPLIDLELRLGEGTGACLALPIVQAAARLLGEMATFDQAGVSDKR
jgi:nicotinate-nucleotide--dimethylbenzimidazole phosphoribosyltransferase